MRMPNQNLQEFLLGHLNELRKQGLYNEIDVVKSPNGPIIERPYYRVRR